MHKKYKSLISLSLALALCNSFAPAMAIDEKDTSVKDTDTPAIVSGKQATSEAVLNASAANFSVTVPTSLPINIDASGTVTVATNAKILNNSSGPVKATGCNMEMQNSWTIVANPSISKVGSKEFSFVLNDGKFTSDGSYDITNWPSINSGDSISLTYEADVAPQSQALNEQIATVVFKMGWDMDGSTPATELNAVNEVDKDKMSMALESLTGSIEFIDDKVAPPKYDIAEDVSSAGDKSVMAYITGEDAVVQSNGGVLAPQDASYLLSDYSATSMDLRGLDTSKTTNMTGMFSTCTSLISLDLSNFNTSSATDMNWMFGSCPYLTSLDISNLDTSKVTDMHDMFYNCSDLTNIDLSTFDTSNVKNMSGMFSTCTNLKSLDLSTFNTSKVEYMDGMFRNCSSLTSLDISNFNTSNVTNMDNLFKNCSSLTSLDLSSFYTVFVSSTKSMFAGCSSLTSLDLSGFGTRYLNYTDLMFSKCDALTTVYVKTQADADKLNASSEKPATTNIVVKA